MNEEKEIADAFSTSTCNSVKKRLGRYTAVLLIYTCLEKCRQRIYYLMWRRYEREEKYVSAINKPNQSRTKNLVTMSERTILHHILSRFVLPQRNIQTYQLWAKVKSYFLVE
jgi:hypothetical protein